MVKTAIYVTLIALSACSVLAEVTEEYGLVVLPPLPLVPLLTFRNY